MFVLNQLQNQHAFTEEISIKSITDNNYQWSFGIYGFYDKLHTKGPVEFKKDGIDSILQPVFDNLKATYPKMPIIKITNESIHIPGTFQTPSYGAAIYHQSTRNNLITEGLSATIGVRLDYEKQDFQYDSQAKMNLSMQMSPVMPPTDISDRYPASVINEKLSQDFWQVLPKIAVKYECTPRTFTYFSAAKGYKAGGYNVQMSADIMQSQLIFCHKTLTKSMFMQPYKWRPQKRPYNDWR
jgi:outer membrane receptor protein involved in Fe transport